MGGRIGVSLIEQHHVSMFGRFEGGSVSIQQDVHPHFWWREHFYFVSSLALFLETSYSDIKALARNLDRVCLLQVK